MAPTLSKLFAGSFRESYTSLDFDLDIEESMFDYIKFKGNQIFDS